jgi:hypothetical protein
MAASRKAAPVPGQRQGLVPAAACAVLAAALSIAAFALHRNYNDPDGSKALFRWIEKEGGDVVRAIVLGACSPRCARTLSCSCCPNACAQSKVYLAPSPEGDGVRGLFLREAGKEGDVVSVVRYNGLLCACTASSMRTTSTLQHVCIDTRTPQIPPSCIVNVGPDDTNIAVRLLPATSSSCI